MPTRRRLAACASIVLLTTPAIAGVAAAESPPAPEKKICRSIVPTGSIMGKRFCLTKSEWKQFDAQNAESAEQGLAGRRNRISQRANDL